jgi:hypothetical protein
MSENSNAEALQAARRAVSRIRAYGVDGPRPIEEIEALLAHQAADVDAALCTVLRGAAADDLVAAVHLVALMRRAAVLEAVREVVFERPAGLDAKREALEALRRCEVEPQGEIVERIALINEIADAPGADALATLLEWPDAWRRPGLDAWLAAAGEDQLGSVEIALGIDSGLDARLLDWIASLGTPEAGRALQRFLAEARDKERIKQVKKALHRMRSQGVELEEVEAESRASGFSLALDGGALQDARAYVTSVDGRGARLVWVLWRAPSGGSRLLQAVIDDSTGVREAEIATVTRQGFRDYVEQMKSNPTVILAQVSLADALAILAAAAARSEETGIELPSSYCKWAEMADVSPSAAGEPAIYRHIPLSEVRDSEALIDEAMKLLREPHFQSWAMEGEVIDAAAEEVYQAETSTLMLNDEQRRERMQDAIRDAVTRSFDDGTRKRYRGRLEAMAEMLWERGEQDAARQALAAAVGLTEIGDLFHKHAFARALAHRGVWLAYQDKQRELHAERQRSGIVQP